jgi:hypothetical protein
MRFGRRAMAVKKINVEIRNGVEARTTGSSGRRRRRRRRREEAQARSTAARESRGQSHVSVSAAISRLRSIARSLDRSMETKEKQKTDRQETESFAFSETAKLAPLLLPRLIVENMRTKV